MKVELISRICWENSCFRYWIVKKGFNIIVTSLCIFKKTGKVSWGVCSHSKSTWGHVHQPQFPLKKVSKSSLFVVLVLSIWLPGWMPHLMPPCREMNSWSHERDEDQTPAAARSSSDGQLKRAETGSDVEKDGMVLLCPSLNVRHGICCSYRHATQPSPAPPPPQSKCCFLQQEDNKSSTMPDFCIPRP